MTDTSLPLTRALISVSDKTGLVDLGRALAVRGVELLSTGGSAAALRDAGLVVKDVSDHTGFPEIMDGRVKTLHPHIHGGILAHRGMESHRNAMRVHGILGIDLVVVNLYPFEAAVARGADARTCVETIDIGGPAMIRAAAKNHAFVTIVTDPAQYGALLVELENHGGATTTAFRRRLATEAFARTAAYDAAIAQWFSQEGGAQKGGAEEPDAFFPERLTLTMKRRQTLRYGENPHQRAAFYTGGFATGAARPGVATAKQIQGKELSYNNLNDTDAAFELAAEFDRPAVAIIKHGNPCGVAEADTVEEAYRHALACDPVSAYGGIIAINRRLDGATAQELVKLFTEVVIAPDLDGPARDILAARKNLRVLVTGAMPDPSAPGMVLRSVSGGCLVQTRDGGRVSLQDMRVVTKRAPSDREMADLLFAFRVCKHVKSNAIVYVRDGATVGVGAGQMSRVDSSRIAVAKAVHVARTAGLAESPVKGSVVASDAFFPFADGLVAAAEAGATAVVQPGGSVRDEEVIAAADERGLAMVFTSMRHFRH